jgi:prephenate dehydratase
MNAKETEEKKVAFQGELGAFSNEAAESCSAVMCRFSRVEVLMRCLRLSSGERLRYCLAPIENSLFGSVYQNYDLLLRHQLCIIGEVNLRIVHNLIGPPGLTVDHIRRVYSHPVALAQCQRFLASRPEIEQMTGYDTAGSVKMLMETREPGSAAIAGASAAAGVWSGDLITGVEDDPQNYTRFWLLSPSNSRKVARSHGQQDFDRLCTRKPDRVALQGSRGVRSAGYRSHEDRITPSHRQPLGVQLLSGL